VKTVRDISGSEEKERKKNQRKKNSKKSENVVRDSIGSLHFQKKRENAV
jgi:hypothetical protein